MPRTLAAAQRLTAFAATAGRHAEIRRVRREVGGHQEIREAAAHEPERHRPEGRSPEGGPAVEGRLGGPGLRRGAGTLRRRRCRRGRRIAEREDQDADGDRQRRGQQEVGLAPADQFGHARRRLREGEVPQGEPAGGHRRDEAALLREPAAHVDRDGQDPAAGVPDGRDDAVERDELPRRVGEAHERRADGHERHRGEHHPARPEAIDQEPECRLPRGVDEEARGRGERERGAVPAQLGEDRLEEDPEREVDARPDEQDDESGGQRPPAPRAGRAHRGVRIRQVPTAWA